MAQASLVNADTVMQDLRNAIALDLLNPGPDQASSTNPVDSIVQAHMNDSESLTLA